MCVLVLSTYAFGFGETNKDDGLEKVVFAVDATWPPMEFINKNKKTVGFSIDMMEAIAKEEGFTPVFITTAWDGIFVGLLNGDYDAILSSVTITEKRKKKIAFSDPYFNAGQILTMRKDLVKGATSLADLKGRKVGAQIGTQGALVVKKHKGVILKTYDELGPAVEELANGTIDGIVADTPLVTEYLLNNKKYKEKFVVIGKAMTQEEYGIATRKGNEVLLQKINNGLAKIKNNGVYKTIEEKWIR